MSVLPSTKIGLGQRPALLVIDAIRGFVETDSPLGMDARTQLDHIAELLDTFRKRRLPVYYAANAYASLDEATVFREKLPALNLLVANGPLAEIHPSVAPNTNERVIRKIVPSAFFDSPLRAILKAEHVDSVVVCGFTTSGCVRASAVDALQCNLRVVVAADACGDRDEEAHAYNLRDLALKTGDVAGNAEILGMLSKLSNLEATLR